MMLWRRAVVAVLLAVFLWGGTASARADEGDVDVLLVLAADVSRSVDEKKFK